MADLDDGPDQAPLPLEQVQETTARLLAGTSYDLILTHGPNGRVHTAPPACGVLPVPSLSFGDRAVSTPSDCGCLRMRTGAGRTCLGFVTMPIGGTCWRTTSGSKSAG